MMWLFAVAAAAAAVAGARFAGSRSGEVDVTTNTSAEAHLLAAFVADPSLLPLYREQVGADSGWFSYYDHRELWQRLCDGEVVGADDFPQPVVEALADPLHADTMDVFRDVLLRGTDDVDGQLWDRSVVHANVAYAAEFRSRYVGTAGQNWTDTSAEDPQVQFEQPLERIPVAVSARTQAFAGAAGASAGVAGWAGMGIAGFEQATITLVAWAVLLPFIFGASLLATVDRYTLRLDRQVAVLWMGVVALSMSVVLLVEPDVPVGPAVVIALAVIGLFEGAAWGWRRFRGVEAHGFGDTLVMPVGIGIPMLLMLPTSPSALQLFVAFLAMVMVHSVVTIGMYVVTEANRFDGQSATAAGLPGWLFGPLLAAPAVAWATTHPYALV